MADDVSTDQVSEGSDTPAPIPNININMPSGLSGDTGNANPSGIESTIASMAQNIANTPQQRLADADEVLKAGPDYKFDLAKSNSDTVDKEFQPNPIAAALGQKVDLLDKGTIYDPSHDYSGAAAQVKQYITQGSEQRRVAQQTFEKNLTAQLIANRAASRTTEDYVLSPDFIDNVLQVQKQYGNGIAQDYDNLAKTIVAAGSKGIHVDTNYLNNTLNNYLSNIDKYASPQWDPNQGKFAIPQDKLEFARTLLKSSIVDGLAASIRRNKEDQELAIKQLSTAPDYEQMFGNPDTSDRILLGIPNTKSDIFDQQHIADDLLGNPNNKEDKAKAGKGKDSTDLSELDQPMSVLDKLGAEKEDYSKLLSQQQNVADELEQKRMEDDAATQTELSKEVVKHILTKSDDTIPALPDFSKNSPKNDKRQKLMSDASEAIRRGADPDAVARALNEKLKGL